MAKPNTTVRKPVKPSVQITKKKLLVLGSVLVLVAAATLFFVNKHSNTHLAIAPASSDSNVQPGTNLSTKPGTYLTVVTDPGEVEGIEGLNVCKDKVTTQSGISCQLSDTNGQIFLKAPATFDKDGKTYTLTGWSGCSSYSTDPRSCTVDIKGGANIAIKVAYTVRRATTPSPDKPFVQLIVYGAASTDSHPSFRIARYSVETVPVKLITGGGVKLADCKITDDVIVDDVAFTRQTNTYSPLASQDVNIVDGQHTFVASCASASGTITAQVTGLITDGKPKLCQNYSFTDAEPTVTSLAQLKSGIVGTWEGCVTTPWTPMYWVTVKFNADGTYAATGSEVIDGSLKMPLYYGGQQNTAKNTYSLDDLQDNNTGIGTLNLVFDTSNVVVEEDLKNVKLSGDNLSFSFKHFNQYGPLVFQLKRQ